MKIEEKATGTILKNDHNYIELMSKLVEFVKDNSQGHVLSFKYQMDHFDLKSVLIIKTANHVNGLYILSAGGMMIDENDPKLWIVTNRLNRNSGHGSELVREAIKKAKEYGWKSLKVKIGITNVPSMTLFLHSGFMITGIERTEESGKRVWILEKKLGGFRRWFKWMKMKKI